MAITACCKGYIDKPLGAIVQGGVSVNLSVLHLFVFAADVLSG